MSKKPKNTGVNLMWSSRHHFTRNVFGGISDLFVRWFFDDQFHARASTSKEDMPLMPYNYESIARRSYVRRARTFQCTACIMVTMLLITMFTLAIVHSTEELLKYQQATESPPAPNLLQLRFARLPFLNRTLPLPDKSNVNWAVGLPTKNELMDAIKKGKEALRKRKKLEDQLEPLENTPASRAQRSVSTAPEVKPLVEAAYAIEEATRSLVAGSNISIDNIGQGPSTVGLLDGPRYCMLQAAPCPITRYRSQDGSCNNLQHPHSWGVSNTPYRRVLPAHYQDGISAPRQRMNSSKLPSARDISLTVHRPSYPHDSAFTVMLAVWGQMVDHDITSMALSKGANNSAIKCCGGRQHPECFPVPLDMEDPFYSSHNLTCMEFVRAAPATGCRFGPREQLNQATAFLDASSIYGYTETKTSQLRHVDGQLRMLKAGARELLPPSKDPNDGCNSVEMIAQGKYCFESGDERANENLHLTTMHLIWARQHNRLARELSALNPGWTEEVVFQESRRIVGAQMQHITYTEFLPSILGHDVMYALGLNVYEKGYTDAYDPTVDPSIANHFASAAFRFAHTLLPGLIHAADSGTGTISYIHLHEILFNPFALYTKRGSKYAIDSGMHTLVHTPDPHVTSELTEHLFERSPFLDTISNTTVKKRPCGLDLVSLNIQRGRDNGLPTYPNFREVCGLSRPQTFDDLRSIFDESSLSRIEQIYESVDDIDLYTGGLAEKPHGRLLGPTFTCLIADQFLRLKVGDRFWYESSDPVIRFSEEQLAEIRKTTLAGVFCANEVDLEWVQPRIMEAAIPTNPLMQCELLPQPTFGPWVDLELPRSKRIKKN